MAIVATGQFVEVLEAAAHGLSGERADYDPLLELVGNSRYLLLVEATHGTHEFYQARADISRRLIHEKGFTVLAWEADWPDALRVNRYLRARNNDASALESLSDFRRFPAWMWRNVEVA